MYQNAYIGNWAKSLFIVCLLFIFSACGGGGGETENSDSSCTERDFYFQYYESRSSALRHKALTDGATRVIVRLKIEPSDSRTLGLSEDPCDPVVETTTEDADTEAVVNGRTADPKP